MTKDFKSISDKDLAELKKVQLEILGEIEKICKKYHLSFFLVGGSLLGAVRHRGYIPWDDDLDIGMTREDFNKFREVVGDEISDKYFFDYFDTDSNYHLPFAKVRKNSTTFGEKVLDNADVHKGIFVDIFVYDYTDNNFKRSFIKEVIIQILSDTVLLKKKLLERNSCKHYVLSSFFCIFNSISILKFIDWFSCNFNGKSKDYIVCFNSLVGLKKEYYEVGDFFPLKEFEFENKRVFGICDFDKYLSMQYGDYMKLPPVEERVNHGVLNLSFTEGKNMKNKK